MPRPVGGPAESPGFRVSSLTNEQRQEYESQGFLLLPGFFSPEELAPWHARFLDIVEERVAPADDMLVMRDVMVAKGLVEPRSKPEAIAKIQDFHNDRLLFDGYCKNPKLLAVVEAFCGPDIKSVHNMLINKPPGVDGRHPLHQDLLYFPFRPADRIVATWTALEPCDRDNGCLVVVPGSHRDGLREHEVPDWDHVNFLYVGAKGADAGTERMHLEMQPGDTVFFHPALLHGSGRNRTARFRRAISCHYASAACRFIEGQAPLPGGSRPYILVRGSAHAGGI